MDFSIEPETERILATMREFVERELEPIEADFLAHPFRELLPCLHEKRAQVKQLGLWTPHMPVELGGMGLEFTQFAHVGEVLGRSPLGHFVFNCQAPDAGNMEILREFGTTAQRQRWLEPLVRGDIRSCFAMTEPEQAGSNPVWLETSAVLDGDTYVIDGHKWFISSADGAAFSIVMAVTDRSAAPHRRASLLIVPTDTAGFRLRRNIPHMGHVGDDWHSHGEVVFEQCRVPRDHLLGNAGAGFAMAQARLGPGRIHHCMRWIGICQRAFDMMCQYAATRAIRPGTMLGTRQSVQHAIADSRAEIDAARLMVLHAAWKIDRLGTRQARIDISLIKFSVAQTLMRVLDRAIQVHGALGVSDDRLLAFLFRSERSSRIYDGPDEVHKDVVARRILKQYGLNLT